MVGLPDEDSHGKCMGLLLIGKDVMHAKFLHTERAVCHPYPAYLAPVQDKQVVDVGVDQKRLPIVIEQLTNAWREWPHRQVLLKRRALPLAQWLCAWCSWHLSVPPSRQGCRSAFAPTQSPVQSRRQAHCGAWR